MERRPRSGVQRREAPRNEAERCAAEQSGAPRNGAERCAAEWSGASGSSEGVIFFPPMRRFGMLSAHRARCPFSRSPVFPFANYFLLDNVLASLQVGVSVRPFSLMVEI